MTSVRPGSQTLNLVDRHSLIYQSGVLIKVWRRVGGSHCVTRVVGECRGSIGAEKSANQKASKHWRGRSLQEANP